MTYTDPQDAYVAGRASAAVELVKTRESLRLALEREQALQSELFVLRIRHEHQQWASMVAFGGCVCLMLVSGFLWAKLSHLAF